MAIQEHDPAAVGEDRLHDLVDRVVEHIGIVGGRRL